MCGGIGLTTQHLSGKSDNCGQYVKHAIARRLYSMSPKEKKFKLHALQLNLRESLRIYSYMR